MTHRREWQHARAPDVRDLHDHVIQRLFGVGLALQSTLTKITDPVVRDRVRQSVAVLDKIIEEARATLPPPDTEG